MKNVKLEEIIDAEGNSMLTALRNAWDQIMFDCLENPLDGKRSLTLKIMAAPYGNGEGSERRRAGAGAAGYVGRNRIVRQAAWTT